MFIALAQRGTRISMAAEYGFLFLQRGAIPKFYAEADQADRLVTAMCGPGRFAMRAVDPENFIHQ